MDCRSCPMKSRVALLEAIVLRGEPVPCPEWNHVLEAILHGDMGPFIEYKARGGVIPDAEEPQRRGGRPRQTVKATALSQSSKVCRQQP